MPEIIRIVSHVIIIDELHRKNSNQKRYSAFFIWNISEIVCCVGRS
jgi:hypothetical protein